MNLAGRDLADYSEARPSRVSSRSKKIPQRMKIAAHRLPSSDRDRLLSNHYEHPSFDPNPGTGGGVADTSNHKRNP
jgi:hypothetical protein